MTSALIRGLRGATTCAADTPELIAEATQELLRAMMARNGLDHDDVVSVLFTTSPDLTSAFPATGARGVGFGDVPLLCARELRIEHGMARCIRVMMHCYSDRPRDQLHHVYLDGARALRDDLPE